MKLTIKHILLIFTLIGSHFKAKAQFIDQMGIEYDLIEGQRIITPTERNLLKLSLSEEEAINLLLLEIYNYEFDYNIDAFTKEIEGTNKLFIIQHKKRAVNFTIINHDYDINNFKEKYKNKLVKGTSANTSLYKFNFSENWKLDITIKRVLSSNSLIVSAAFID